MILTILGAALLAAGLAAAYVLAPRGAGSPASGWHPDPASGDERRRLWDSRTWTDRVADGGPAADRGHRFRGRFWGRWVWILVAAVVVLVVGATLYESSGEVHVIGATSLVGMTLVCWAFYRFVARQLALDDVIGLPQVVAVVVATSGAVLLIAANVNTWVIDSAGISTATALVGVVEEGTKFLVPVVLFLLARYRDPRAGVAIGLASGFGFAITETTQYAYQTALSAVPDFCGTGTAAVVAPESVVQAQVFRILTVSPLHWLWTGIAVAIAWRLWHLRGARGTWGAVGGLLLVMVVHSLNDSSLTSTCDAPALSSLFVVLRWVLLVVMYLTFKAWSRKSTPPQIVGKVSRGWLPKHLPSVREDAPAPSAEPGPAEEGGDLTRRQA